MIVDVHAHYVSEKLVDEVVRGSFAPYLTAVKMENRFAFKFPTRQSGRIIQRLTDLQHRMDHMDQCNIDLQLLSTSADILAYDLPKETALNYYAATNNELARAVKEHPTRFRFLASVPLQWTEESVSILENAVRNQGAVGSFIGTNLMSANLDDPKLEPFWRKSEELGIPVILHPFNVAGSDRLKAYYMYNLIGNPLDTTIAASSLIFGGVLDRHPKLKVILLHGGGYLPYAIGRLDHGYQVRPETKTIKQPPSSYLKRFFCDVIVFDSRLLQTLSLMIGTDRMLLGTDYPFDMEPDDVVGQVRSVIPNHAEKILEVNWRGLFNLGI